MGRGNWTDHSYRSYSATHSLNTASVDQTFTRKAARPEFKAADIKIRESRDSEDHPNSVPIMFGVDLTGSMGEYAALIVKEALPKVMEATLQGGVIEDPQLLFMGFDDHLACPDRVALQASQFESDIRIVEQLRDIHLTRGGGCNSTESYELPWYFAAHKTVTDAWEKRGQKGVLFTAGDENAPHAASSANDLTRVFGLGEYPSSTTPAKMLADAREKWMVFHFVIEEGSHARGHLTQVRGSWTEMLGPNAIFLRDFKFMPQVVEAILRVVLNDEVLADVVSSSEIADELRYAFHNALSGSSLQV